MSQRDLVILKRPLTINATTQAIFRQILFLNLQKMHTLQKFKKTFIFDSSL